MMHGQKNIKLGSECLHII